MHIVITGGTGLVGQALRRFWQSHQITIVSRRADWHQTQPEKPAHVNYVSDLHAIDFMSVDAVVNLAGEPIAEKRWSASQKRRICQSRWIITEQLAQKLKQPHRVHTFINASAIGFYGRQQREPIDESYRACFPEFSHELCQRWEELALGISNEQTRVAIVRIGIVLSDRGGALSKMLPAFKLGLGGRLGDGEQMMSWIHIDDLVRLFDWLLNTPSLHGVFNGTAPKAVSNREWTQQLSHVLHRPAFFHVPAAVLKLLLGEMSDLLLYGQNVRPARALEHGFSFQYPDLATALHQLYPPRL